MSKILRNLLLIFVLVLVATTTVNAQQLSPSLEIITPSDGQTIYGNKVPILFNVENLEIVDYQSNTTPAAGKGHIHIWLDDQNPTPVSAKKIVEDTFTFSDVPYGNHTLMAELVGNTHQSLTPPQKVTVNFASAQISTPEAATTSGFDKKTALVILVVVALVIVAAWWYTKDEDEEEMEEKPKKKTVGKKASKRRKG